MLTNVITHGFFDSKLRGNEKMKRISAIFMAIIMVLSLASCGNAASTNSTGSNATKKVLKVGMECAYAPYNWSQSGDANGAVPIKGSSDYAYGYDIIIAKYVAGKMGMDLEICKLDWDSLPTAVQSGTIDCAIAGQSITSKRKETLNFTTPYYYASIVNLVKSNSPYASATGISGLSGAKATSQINTVWYDTCIPQIPNVNKLTSIDSAPAMLVALDSGATDVIVTDMPTAKAACVAYPSFKLLDFTSSNDNYQVSEEEINIGISVSKSNTELLDSLNAALANLTKDDFSKMMDQAIAAQPLSK